MRAPWSSGLEHSHTHWVAALVAQTCHMGGEGTSVTGCRAFGRLLRCGPCCAVGRFPNCFLARFVPTPWVCHAAGEGKRPTHPSLLPFSGAGILPCREPLACCSSVRREVGVVVAQDLAEGYCSLAGPLWLPERPVHFFISLSHVWICCLALQAAEIWKWIW